MQNKYSSLPAPLENEEQITLFQWARLQSGKHPELSLLYHIPNGGSRNKAEASRLQAEGVKAGVPDLCLPVPRGTYHGLYIELKRIRGSKTSDLQVRWMESLMKQGYYVNICKGWKAAAQKIIDYLGIRGEQK